MKRLYLILIALLIFSNLNLFAQNELELSREFKLITSENAAGYLKPFFTTIGESWHTNLYTTANYKEGWSFGLDISIMGMIIPSSHLNYQAALPEYFGNTSIVDNAELRGKNLKRNLNGFVSEPTIYGGSSNPVFAAPQNHRDPDSTQTTVAFIEGQNVSFMPGLPNIQLTLGLPTMSELRFRYFFFPIEDVNMNYFMIGLNQNIDKLFDMFDKKSGMALALHGAYNSMSRSPGIDVSGINIGVHFSSTSESGFTFYAGTQYESFSGSVNANRTKDSVIDKYIDSPYEEIRESLPFNLNIESFNNFRLTGGLAYRLGPLELHADVSYAAQPVVSTGLTFWFTEPDAVPEIIIEPYPIPELVDPPPIAHNFPKMEPSVVPAMAAILKKKIPLEGDITAYGLDGEIESPLVKILIEEFQSRQMRALLPFVFFDDNSSKIPDKYKLLTSEQTSKFSKNDLLGQSSLENYYHILNILGQRLTQYPNANITITGCNSNIGKEKNNKKLSQERAESVRNYLASVWNISSDRMKIKTLNLPQQASNSKDPDGIEENRRVEIVSDIWEITAPSIIDDTLRRIKPNSVRFKPTLISGKDIANWDVNVSVEGGSAKNFSGTTDLPANLDWSLLNEESLKTKMGKELNYSLKLKDSDNELAVTPTKSIPVEYITVKKKQENLTRDTVINIYNLILFDFNKSTIGTANQKIVDFIKAESPENSIIKVIGYTDRIGNDAHNLKLSTDRAKSTTKALNRPNAEIIGKGESELIYDNNSPEGRFYCRTVVVEVKIPKN